MEIIMNLPLLMLEGANATGRVIEYSSWGFADRAAEAAKTSLLGIGTVFAVLAILWLVLEVFRYFFYDIPNKKKNASTPKTEDSEIAPTPVMDAAPTETDDAEIVAAIMAAISVMCDKPTTSFRVVSFRKTGTK